MSKRNLISAEMDEEGPSTKQKSNGHWSNGLLISMEDPTYLVESDELTVVIKDKFPKAEFHYLIMPKENIISSLKAVKSDHLTLLKHMHTVGEKIMKDHRHKEHTFIMGYHAEASMFKLHMHLISDDFISPCLKTRKHWNSYTTKFFLHSADICEQLENEDKISLPSAEECRILFQTRIKCHKCDFYPRHMPDLKHHLLTHSA